MAKLFGSAVPSFFESGAKHTSHSQVETLPGRGLRVPCAILGVRCYLSTTLALPGRYLGLRRGKELVAVSMPGRD